MSDQDIYDAGATDSPDTPRVIKEVREDLINRISEIQIDEQSILGEVAKLSICQEELQKELQAVMQAVQIVEFEDDDEDDLDSSLHDTLCREGSIRSLSSLEPSSEFNDDDDSDARRRDSIRSISSPQTRRSGQSPAQNRPSFAKAFFKLSRPRNSLEAQKERQKEIVREKMAASFPGLEDIMEIQEEMQREIVQETLAEKEKTDQENPAIEDCEVRISLEEEKSLQMEMLARKLQEIDPELMREMTSQKNTQAEIVAEKEKEIRLSLDPSKVAAGGGRLTQTKSTKNFWNGAMSKLEGMVSPRPVKKNSPETIAEETDNTD